MTSGRSIWHMAATDTGWSVGDPVSVAAQANVSLKRQPLGVTRGWVALTRSGIPAPVVPGRSSDHAHSARPRGTERVACRGSLQARAYSPLEQAVAGDGSDRKTEKAHLQGLFSVSMDVVALFGASIHISVAASISCSRCSCRSRGTCSNFPSAPCGRRTWSTRPRLPSC